MVATGRPPPEVVQPSSTIPTNPTPPTFANLFKSPIPAIGDSSHGENPSTFDLPRKPVHYLHGEPTIRLSHQEIAMTIEQQDLTYAVIGKFSHGMPDLTFLRMAIPKQCELKADVKVGLLHNRHVLIRCTIEEDYVTLMSRPELFGLRSNPNPF
ncbi:hypothetical protein RND71_042000 [Anisodus tanguticus]|uniref:DUF4283 domain-containing protein n=1 Tax=Anisodus tanguticus TaxID=243964 RepID=A0AAE1UQB3_9SOLA|nr:hypothetical protein RND71_042000 [Anisodus tanguticus]